MARPREIDRDRILDAAQDIMVASEGRGLTLDAVAERAGISKGGLVYSFATKDELIAAALERELERFLAAWDGMVEGNDRSASSMLSAYIREILNQDEAHLRTASLLMTALSNAPKVSEPARRFYRAVFQHFDASTARGRDIRQAILAIEGLFLLRGLGLVNCSHDEWLSVVNHALITLQHPDMTPSITMHNATAAVSTEHASRYLQQLCKHWSHRFTVAFTPEAGRIDFGDGETVELTAQPAKLEIRVWTAGDLAELERVVEEHLQRFGFREQLVFEWRPA